MDSVVASHQFMATQDDLVVALHDFTAVASSSNTCLSFKAGQVLRVLNRDPSGWWDGETVAFEEEDDPTLSRRGWFPSNYTVSYSPDSDQWADQRPSQSSINSVLDPASSPVHSSAALTTASGSVAEDPPEPTSASAVNTDLTPRPESPSRMTSTASSSRRHSSESASVLDTIIAALTHLQRAAQRGRIAQIQPCTAYVISSVRSMLDATDCLARESSILAQHPSLARERKLILTVLASLVEKARKITAPSASSEDLAQQTEEILRVADNVFAHVRKFLVVVQQCGLDLPEPSQLKYAKGGRNLLEADSTKVLRSSKSVSDIRQQRSHAAAFSRRKGSESSIESQGEPLTRQRSRTAQWDAMVAADGAVSRPMSPTFLEQDWSRTHSASSSVSSVASSSGPLTPAGPSMHSAADVLILLRSIHDSLLSTVAAFIGHVHAHSRSSHPASYAHLIDMTRETIDRVRDILVVVESVISHPSLETSKRKEITNLTASREMLYVATTSLVTAARVATSPTTAEGADLEDEEKTALLASATSVLRAGNACISNIRYSIRGTASAFELTFRDQTSPPPPKSSTVVRVDEVREDATESDLPEVLTQRRGVRSGRKSQHTISMLGRKATSLACIKHRWEKDAENMQDDMESDEEAREWLGEDAARSEAHSSRQPSRSGSMSRNGSFSSTNLSSNTTMQGVQGPFGDHFDPSMRPVILSRTSSRASLRSKRSRSRSGSNPIGSLMPMQRNPSSIGSASTAPSMLTSRSQDSAANMAMEISSGLSQLRQGSEVDEKEWLLTGSEQNTHDRLMSMSSRATLSPQLGRSRAGSESSHMAQLGVNMSVDWLRRRDYAPAEVAFNSDGAVTGGTLKSLVERLTLHDSLAEAAFFNAFFLTFRMFCSPAELAAALIARFHLVPPSDVVPSPEEAKAWNDQKILPVRLRVYNTFKTWLELHWRADTDGVALRLITDFASQQLLATMPQPANRLLELVQKRAQGGVATSMPRAAALATPVSMDQLTTSTPPLPIISRSLLSQLRSGSYAGINVQDFDPLELARQVTIMESKLFGAIRAEELLGQEFSKKAGLAVNVRAMSSLSTKITGWIAETILNEQDTRKRTSLVKFFIKLGDKCLMLQNYNALMAIVTALNSSTILRLKKTWEGLPNKYRGLYDSLNRAVNHARNYAEYRANLKIACTPCIPFLGVYLTDITFCHEGNPTTRASPLDSSMRLINFDRYMKLSRIIGDLKRFQVGYNLTEVTECQTFIRHALDSLQLGASPDSLYRRSLKVEPREASTLSSIASSLATSSNLSVATSTTMMTSSSLAASELSQGGSSTGSAGDGDHKSLFNWKI